MLPMQIPFLNLKKLNAPYEKEFNQQFKEFLNSGYYILGNSVKQFENEFATYCGVKHCIGTGNGLDALTLILKGYTELGLLKKGDKVIVAANTYIATIIAIENAGMIPVLIDANENTFNLDSDGLPKNPSSKVKAILVTHLYGRLAEMKPLNQYCKHHNLLLISDAAQAHGAQNNQGQKAGSLAHASGFSFYPTKNLGALGDGGAVTTNNSQLAEVISKLRNYGKSSTYINEYIGINSRLDEIQASFLRIKLKKLDMDNKKRQEIAIRYSNELDSSKIKLPIINNPNSHVFHQFTILVDDRDQFIEYLNKHQIGSLIHYPIPPYQQKPYQNNFGDIFPISNKIANKIVSIPCNPIVSNEQLSYIIKTINLY